MKSDLTEKTCIVAFVFVLHFIIIFCVLFLVSDSGCSKVSDPAKQVLIKEQIEESEIGDIWRTSIYRLDSVIYDTIPNKK